MSFVAANMDASVHRNLRNYGSSISRRLSLVLSCIKWS